MVRIDEVELKGFDGLRPIYTLAPRDDPGLADSQAARNALDQQMFCKAMAYLKAVDSGMLQAAAKTLLQRFGSVRSPLTRVIGSEPTPKM